MSGVLENVLKPLKEGVEVTLQLDRQVVIQAGLRHFEWCALLFRMPVDGVAFISAETSTTASEVQHGLLVAMPGTPKNAADRLVIIYMEKHYVNGTANFHLQVLGVSDHKQAFAACQCHVSCRCFVKRTYGFCLDKVESGHRIEKFPYPLHMEFHLEWREGASTPEIDRAVRVVLSGLNCLARRASLWRLRRSYPRLISSPSNRS